MMSGENKLDAKGNISRVKDVIRLARFENKVEIEEKVGNVKIRGVVVESIKKRIV